jgi:hypothetical protein
MKKILEDADVLAARFESYEPREEDERASAGPKVTNTAEYEHTRRKLADLEQLIEALSEGSAGDDGFRDLQLAGLRSQAEDLREELAEFDQRRSNTT